MVLFLMVSITILTAYLGGINHKEMDVVFFDGDFNVFPIRIIFENLLKLDPEITSHSSN